MRSRKFASGCSMYFSGLVSTTAPLCRLNAIDEDDEDAVARIGGHVEALALRRRIAPRGLGGKGVEPDEIEALDLLRLAVLGHFEIAGLQVLDDLAVLQRGGVHPDEMRAAAKNGALLGL